MEGEKMRFNKYNTNMEICVNPNFCTIANLRNLGFVDFANYWSFSQHIYDYDLFYEIRIYPDRNMTLAIEVSNGSIVQDSVFDIDRLMESNDTTVSNIALSMYNILYRQLQEFEQYGLIYFKNFQYGDAIVRY